MARKNYQTNKQKRTNKQTPNKQQQKPLLPKFSLGESRLHKGL